MSTVCAALCRVTEKARACAGFFFVACALFSLAGCISMPQSEALRDAPPQDLPRRVDLDKQVPFHLQDDFLCGPATLAMAFNAAGVPATVESLTPMVYLPGRKGSLQPEMLGATRRHGLVAYTPPPQMEAVLRELAAGTPVIVLLNLSVKLMPVWHYAVLIGYDLDKREVIVRSAKKPRDEWSFGFLEFFWQDSNYWSLLALPPGRLAATAREQEFSLAVAALEQAGKPAEARASYRALLERWPDNLLALIGLGNTEYALKNLAGAEEAFRRASVAHPKSAVAFNNLAHVLAGLGKLAEAEAAARTAVALEGPTLPEAKKTLDEIVARRARS
jgi:hypothetical protein